MSNAGVIMLAEKTINGQSFRIEDNIGEAIHIHFGNMRIDMTVNEFLDFGKQTENIVNQMIDIDGFDVRNFNPICLYEIMCRFINLRAVSLDHVQLSQLNTYSNDGNIIKISDSRVVEALAGNTENLMKWQQINLYSETNHSRFESIIKSIKENGYPLNNEYIILNNDGYFVVDGLHRASCLFHLYGDIEIPVIRLYFHENAYSDKFIESDYKYIKVQDYIQKNADNMKDVFVSAMYAMSLNSLLTGKNVAIKGAGNHTQEVLKLISSNKDISVKCIIAKDDKMVDSFGIDIIKDSDVHNYDIDVILISSFTYRHEMLRELIEFDENYELLDIYQVIESAFDILLQKGIV